MTVLYILKFIVVGLIVGSIVYGVLSTVLFAWIVPERHWSKVWLACIVLTYIAYGEEILKSFENRRESRSQSITERYEQITAEK